MPKSTKPNHKSRRGFLTGAAARAAGLIARPPLAMAQQAAHCHDYPPSGGMPPYRAKVMSDQELLDVWSYIQTFPAPAPAKDIPLLSN